MKYKVVVIDDNTDILDLLQEILPKSRFSLFTANRGEDGLELIYSIDPPTSIGTFPRASTSSIVRCASV